MKEGKYGRRKEEWKKERRKERRVYNAYAEMSNMLKKIASGQRRALLLQL